MLLALSARLQPYPVTKLRGWTTKPVAFEFFNTFLEARTFELLELRKRQMISNQRRRGIR